MLEKKHIIAKQIASLLMQILKLSQDDSLVAVFGTGHEKTNMDAITHWVELHMSEIDDEKETLLRLRSAANGGNHAVM